MAAMWNPESNGLQQILQLLRESQSPDNTTQRTVQQVSFIVSLLAQYRWAVEVLRLRRSPWPPMSDGTGGVSKHRLGSLLATVLTIHIYVPLGSIGKVHHILLYYKTKADVIRRTAR